MVETVASPLHIAFGPFRLLPAQRLLLDGADPVPLGSRAIDLLLALLERPGELVSRDTLMSRVWPDTFVSESNLRVQVAGLRRAIRDGEGGERYIVATPGRGYRFVAPITFGDGGSTSVDEPSLGVIDNLPAALTRVIGRLGPIATIAGQLRARRLTTIVGPGGIGKTTVALAVAREVSAQYAGGVAFLDLSPLGDASLVPAGLATILRLTVQSDDPLPAILTWLAPRNVLLVIDNCEHLVDAAASLAERVLEAAPHVHILATSREPLRAVGERIHRLASLESPPSGVAVTAAEALTYPGVELFVERASATLSGFELTDAGAPVVAEICRQLDGMALAIELAARRVDAFSLEQLNSHLGDRFRLLTTGRRTALARHQTLAATLDWSYQLLPATESELLRRLCVFAAPFPLDAAVAVMPDLHPADVALQVAELVSKSLLNVEESGLASRYRLLETTRLFGLEKLKADGGDREVVRLHAEYVSAALADPGSRHVGSHDPRTYLPDLRAALDWAFSDDGDADLGVTLTVRAVPVWVQLSSLGECRRAVERALAALDMSARGAPYERMVLHAALGWSLMYTTAKHEAVRSTWAETLRLASELGDTSHNLRALWGLWVNGLNTGAFRAALDRAREFADLAHRSSDAFDMIMADRLIGTSFHFVGDQVEACLHLKRALARQAGSEAAGSLGASRFQADQGITAKYFLARVLWLRGFPDRAVRLAHETVELAQSSATALSLASALGQGACPLALLTGDLDGAERFAGMLLDHSRRNGLGVWQAWARCFGGLVSFRRGDRGGLDAARYEIKAAEETSGLPRFLLLLVACAACLGAAGEVSTGLAMLDGTLERCEAHDELWLIAEMLRVKGELTKATGRVDARANAESLFVRGLAYARAQGAMALELRLAISLARLRLEAGQLDLATGPLAAAYGRFTEGFATDDLRAAQQILGLPPASG